MDIAILITCHNRKTKTLSCLESVYTQTDIANVKFNIFLVDDGSTDGTADEVNRKFPDVTIIKGNGSLFWAGGMRMAWTAAINAKINIDYFLLLNDDTLLYKNCLSNLFADVKKLPSPKSILISPTVDLSLKTVTYGGSVLLNNTRSQFKMLSPNFVSPQQCDLGNANIMLVPFDVYKEIGILSDKYTHGIADFDYTLRAKDKKIPTYIASDYGGICDNDHGKNWRSSKDYTLKQRVKYLYSPTGLAYKEYLYYIKTHFPKERPIAFFKLWLKTLVPVIYDKLK